MAVASHHGSYKYPIVDLVRENQQYEKQFTECLQKTLNTGRFVLGKHVEELETEMRNYLKCRYHGVGVSSGTAALELVFKYLAEKYHDLNIIVPANAYIADILAILPITDVLTIVDVDEYGRLPATSILAEIDETKTNVILLVHLFGRSGCDELFAVYEVSCYKSNIILIEDCAQSLGARIDGSRLGSFGQFSVHSFYPTKNLGGLGDGGMILCQNEEDSIALRKYRNLGTHKTRNVHEVAGTNARLDELQAQFLLCKFPFVDNNISKKIEIASWYRKHLPIAIVEFCPPDEYYTNSYHLYVVKLPKWLNRDKFQIKLQNHGIETAVHYPTVFWKQPCWPESMKVTMNSYKGNAEAQSQNILSLPMHIFLTETDIVDICACIRQSLYITGTGCTIIEPVNLYGCTLGDNVRVGPFTEIQCGVTVGSGTVISSHSFLCEGVNVGNESFIGHGVMFTNDKGKRTNPTERPEIYKQCVVGDKVFVGSGSVILPVTIGNGSVIGAGSVVTKPVQEGTTVAGNPARLLPFPQNHEHVQSCCLKKR